MQNLRNVIQGEYIHPELAEFKLKIALLVKHGVEPMNAKRIVASDRISKSERKSQGLPVYNETPEEPDPDTVVLRERWNDMRRAVKQIDESVAALLVSCGVVAVDCNTVMIGTHIDKVAERLQFGDRREIIAQMLREFWQANAEVEFVWAERAFWFDERCSPEE